jgi:hypothetical protein
MMDSDDKLLSFRRHDHCGILLFVGADTMVNALADSVKPRLGSSDDKALDSFQSFLLNGLKNGGAKVDTTLR